MPRVNVNVPEAPGRAGATLARFLRWWTEELRELGVELIARVAPKWRQRAIVTVVGQELRIPETLPAKDIVLVLPVGAGLVRRLTLPAEARRRLSQVIALQLEHLTPFKRDSMYWDYRHRATETREMPVEVDLAIVRKRDVDALLAKAEASGLHVCAVALEGAEGAALEFNFLPHRRRQEFGAGHSWDRPLAASFAIGVLAFGGVTGWQWHVERKALDTAVTAARQEAASVTQMEGDIRQRLLQLQALEKEREAPALGEILADLGGRLPPEVWLTQFALEEGHARFEGIAPAFKNIAPLVEASPLATNVALESSTSLGVGTSRDRFWMVFNAQREGMK